MKKTDKDLIPYVKEIQKYKNSGVLNRVILMHRVSTEKDIKVKIIPDKFTQKPKLQFTEYNMKGRVLMYISKKSAKMTVNEIGRGTNYYTYQEATRSKPEYAKFMKEQMRRTSEAEAEIKFEKSPTRDTDEISHGD